ncbi:hypothetical protein FQA39_LY04235 [Lamprigera yunnana]|nr:hypothetical protein FQA39_LY04235 [Lamprigera yunnana]
MIIGFHCLYIVTKCIVNRLHKPLQESDAPRNTVDLEHNLIFDPPVYKQRYAEVQLILLDSKWKHCINKIVDFGCAEMKLFPFIKRLYRVNEVLEIDIDEGTLRENLFRVEPVIGDYIDRRSEPLQVNILKGSISDPDQRLLDTDAVIGIEIIEHLYPDVLEGIPYNIFGFAQPKMVVFTTPNADFNVLFPNFKGFRHYDHKFEWTREQFESWALNIITRYPDYTVSFRGIGEGPEGMETLGCCSQVAVFVRKSDMRTYTNDQDASFGICSYYTHYSGANHDVPDNKYYELIHSITYPYDTDKRTPEEKIYNELQYRINLRSNINGRFYNEELERFEIPVVELIYNQYTNFTSEREACEILEKAGHKLEECIVFEKLEPCVVFVPDMESSSSSSGSYDSDISIESNSYTMWTSIDKELDDKDSQFIDSATIDHQDASILATEIVQNIINGSQPSTELHEKLLETSVFKSSNKENENTDCLRVNKDDAKSNISSAKELKNDGSRLEMPEAKKKKKPKKGVAQNGSGSDDCSEDLGENKQCIEVVHEVIEEIVENGDLANNNRDLEGNNYPNALQAILPIAENENQNRIPDLQDNVNNDNERNYDVENRNNIEQNFEGPNLPMLIVQEQEEIEEVEAASREALFDPNSQIDLLSDFDTSADDEPENSNLNLPVFGNIVFVGISPHEENVEAAAGLNVEPFPNWLLNLLTAGGTPEDETHDEPHFYCQGDGVGVHPSFVEEDFELDSSTSGSSGTSSSNNSHDETEADPSISELDSGSLQDEIVDINTEQNLVAQISPCLQAEQSQVENKMFSSHVSSSENENLASTLSDSEHSPVENRTFSTHASLSENESSEEYFDTIDDSSSVTDSITKK